MAKVMPLIDPILQIHRFPIRPFALSAWRVSCGLFAILSQSVTGTEHIYPNSITIDTMEIAMRGHRIKRAVPFMGYSSLCGI